MSKAKRKASELHIDEVWVLERRKSTFKITNVVKKSVGKTGKVKRWFAVGTLDGKRIEKPISAEKAGKWKMDHGEVAAGMKILGKRVAQIKTARAAGRMRRKAKITSAAIARAGRGPTVVLEPVPVI
jgi:IS4 transposase